LYFERSTSFNLASRVKRQRTHVCKPVIEEDHLTSRHTPVLTTAGTETDRISYSDTSPPSAPLQPTGHSARTYWNSTGHPPPGGGCPLSLHSVSDNVVRVRTFNLQAKANGHLRNLILHVANDRRWLLERLDHMNRF